MRGNCSKSLFQRLISLVLVCVMVVGYIPVTTFADTVTPITTVSDPATLSRPEDIYGNNTANAGKITVGKSVSDADLDSIHKDLKRQNPDNFLVTVSQTAQVAGLTSKSAVPVDVVLVLDTSGSMNDDGRAGKMVTAANTAIDTLMSANENNRVGVVAFSSKNYGKGSSNGAAANVLSSLRHYTGDAASNHLVWVDENNKISKQASNNVYIRGRSSDAYRHGKSGGTNIQAGIAVGAQMLTGVADTTWTNPDTRQTVNRIPFLIILSDGQPTFTYTSQNWYAPSGGDSEQGPGSSSYEGNGFLAALTAAYYKGKITEHYYAANASETNRCYVYTIGVDINSLSAGDDKNLAQITLDPATYTTGSNAEENAASYWNYGNTANEWEAKNRKSQYGWKTYWQNYQAANAADFTIRVNYADKKDVDYTVKSATINATRSYVNGVGYTGGIAYNDGYYETSNVNDLGNIFKSLVATINEKALSVPTKVTGTPEFSGYVTFTDPIGEFMEVKDMMGVYAEHYLYDGDIAAQNLNGNPSGTFLTSLRTVLKERLTMTGSQNVDALVEELIAGRRNSTSVTDNSITWWGRKIASSEESHVQCLGYADVTSDNVTEFIKTAAIPTINGITPDTLCRSYFFYGENQTSHEYMHCMVRIQQDLMPPYQQTVVVSIPASLLSVDQVMITENKDSSAIAKIVEDDEPLRVVYEVGLRSDITISNVKDVVEAEMPSYAAESGNVDSEGQYRFYTNDWDREASESSHHRAMAKATFEAAQDNPFYAYQTNTPILVENGNTYTQYTDSSAPVGTFYYAQEYYDWDGSTANADGTYNAVKRTTYIPISIAANEPDIAQDGSGWYVKQGTYTAHSLVVNGEDVTKQPNNTGTSSIVSHPHQTDSGNDSHYTVLLGNNGRLTMPYVKTKDVYKTDAANAKINVDGKVVGIGDVLTYEIKVVNTEAGTATAQVTDQIPAGTVYVADSASNGGVLSQDGKSLTWSLADLAPGSTTTLSFQVKVTESVIANTVASVNNQASVSLNNKFAYNTNTTVNPPEGKVSAATDNNGGALTDTVLKVGDQLTYTIRYANDSAETATVVVTDQIPAGTTYKRDSASSGGTLSDDGKTLTWTIPNVPAGLGGTVSFAVYVDASAKVNPEAATQPESGNITLKNYASIKIGENDPRYTNETNNNGGVGDLSLTKSVALPTGVSAESEVFTMILSESAGKLSGTYVVTGSTAANSGSITFANGVGTVAMKAGDTITVKGLPLGATISVIEDTSAESMKKWDDTYQNNPNDGDGVTIVVTQETGKTVDVSVKNTFLTVPVEFRLHAVKQFSQNFPEGSYSFGFQAQQCNEDGSAMQNGRVVYATATKGEGNADVSFSFTPRTFSEKTTLYYKITENVSADLGVIIDPTQYLLKLVIDYPEGSNELTAQTWYKEVGVHNEWQEFEWQDPAKSHLVFKNSYVTDTSTEISGTKNLTGRYITSGEFSFELLDSQQNVISNTNVTASGTTNSGSFSFPRYYSINDLIDNGQIVDENKTDNIEGERTFTYYVRETNKGETGIKYDTKVYQVAVKLTLNDGVLSAAPTSISLMDGTAVDAVVFTNEFELEDVFVRLQTSKAVTGDHTLTAGEFSFFVYEADANYRITNDKPVASGANKTDGTVDLGLLEYVPADLRDANGNYVDSKTFYYVVKENIPAQDAPTFDPGMFYDAGEKRVTVTVSRSGNKMTATIDDVDVSNGDYQVSGFTNNRVSRKTEVTPVAQKTTTGNYLPDDLRFSFAVRPAKVVDGKVTEISGTAATGVSQPAAADGTAVAVDFTKLVYNDSHLGSNESAIFYYVIEESNTGVQNGVGYDTTKYLMQVTLTRDAETKQLSAATSYYELAEDGTFATATATPSFNNKYHSEVSVNVSARKSWKEGSLPYALEDGEFDFRLQRLQKQTDGSFVPVEGSFINGTNAADGTITFGTINFAGGLHKQSTPDVEYVPATLETTDEAGTVIPAEPEHWLVRYQMSEIKPDGVPLAGMEYDTNVHRITIKLYYEILDDGNTSVLRAKWVEEANPPTFYNKYTVQNEAQVTITAKKTLTGRDLRDGEFAYNLYRVDGTTEHFAAGATNDANGNISFTRVYNTSVLQFPADRNTYEVVYHLTETPPATGGVSWVSGDYYVKVVITHDTKTASYSAAVEGYYNGYDSESGECIDKVNNPAEEVVFVNKYVPAGTSFEIGATKQLLDKDSKKLAIAENQFSFQVKEVDENGAVLNADVIAGTGNSAACDAGETADVAFTPISVSTAGDHYYEISEVEGTNAVVTYTDAKYYVKVPVSDDSNGQLHVGQVTYHTGIPCTEENKIADSAVMFTNHQGNGAVDVSLHLNVDKTVHVLNANGDYVRTHNLTGDEYDFAVFDAAGNQVATGSNTAANANGIADIIFENFNITLDQFNQADADQDGAHVFSYTVKEISGDQAATDVGVSLDPGIITVDVTVHKDEYKNLSVTNVAHSKNQKVGTEVNNLFVNTFTFQPVTLSLSGSKGLNGKALEAGDFRFELSGGNLTNSVIKTNDADGKIDFGTLPAFLAPGTFTYTVKEVGAVNAPSRGEYSTDPRVTTVVVTVTADVNGILHAVPMYYHNYGVEGQEAIGGIAFSNLYVPNPVELDLNAAISLTKKITDESGNQMNLPLNGFQFELVGITGDDNAKITGVTDDQGVVDFPAISFSDDATYSFYIRESNPQPNKPGYEIDPDAWMVEVTVSYNGGTTEIPYTNVKGETTDAQGNEITAKPGELYIQQGNVKIVPNASGETDGVFTNVYNPVPGQAVISVQKILEGRDLRTGEFTFHLKDGDRIVAEATNDANGNVTFTVPYTGADMNGADNGTSKTFNYTIEEVVGNAGGVAYDTTVKNGSVTVTMNDKGELKAAVHYADEMLFVNEYSATETQAQIMAFKTIEGRNLIDGMFSFVLTGNSETHEAHNRADGSVVFAPLTFNMAGVYEYTLQEKIPADSEKVKGMTYDETVYTVTVTVTDDYAGKLHASVAYSKNGTSVTTPEFFNSFDGDAAFAEIEAIKILETNSNRVLKGEEFSFQLMDASGNVLETVKNDVNGHVNFTAIAYEEAGVHEYTINEVIPEERQSGMAYDENEHLVTVTVVQDEVTGHYAATVAYQNDTTPVFTNRFQVQSVSVVLEAAKELAGRKLNADEFTFELVDAATGDVLTATNAEDGSVTFDAISYDKAGTYEYTIREVKGNAEGITYDETEYKATVTVVDTDGNLSTQVNYEGGSIVFKNKHTGKPTSAAINAKKTLKTDSLRLLKAGEFTFELVDENGKVLQTKSNNLLGNVAFDAIEYTAEGEYEYIIREAEGTETGMTYDETEYKVVVKVVRDATTGDYSAQVIYETSDGQQPTFVNVFKPLSVDVTINSNKQPHGRDLKKGEFTFTLTDAAGKQIKATNDENGLITFGPIEFNKAGVFEYTVREIAGNANGMEYDNRTYRAVVTVTDTDGVLTAEVTYPDGAILFENTYTGKPAHVEFGAKKTLKTDSLRLLKAGEFTFELVDENGKVLQTKSNNLLGNVAFDAISYNAEGEYKYTIREVKGTESGMTYDETVYEVVVKVTRDKTTGDYIAVVEYKTANGKAPVFTNYFKPGAVLVRPEAEKQLTGRPLRAGEFTFTVYDSEGKKVGTASNNADGKILFDAISFEKAGTYTFTMVEEETRNDLGNGTMTVDRTVHTFVVTVTDTDGVLSAEITYEEGGIVFRNAYTGAPTSATINAKKTLKTDSLRLLKAGEFTFELVDAKTGEVLQTKTNSILGNVAFDAIEYAAEGEYEYIIREVAGTETGMTYDKTEYKVVVKVVKGATTGDYGAQVIYETSDGQQPTFVNVFKPLSVSVKLTAAKKLTGRALKNGEFSFTVYDADGKKQATGTNNAKGEIVFSDLSFSKTGVYKFTVKENKGMAWYMTYDRTSYEVTVIVTEIEGVLKAEVVYPNGGISFHNVYNPSGDIIPQTGDETPLALLIGVAATSAMGLAAMFVLWIKRKKRKE